MYQVLIVDDQRTARQVLESAIAGEFRLAHSIENAALAELYCVKEQIDLILMDVCTAHGESGLEAAAKIKRLYPRIKIIIVTSMPEHSFIQKAKAAGCESFWYKDFGVQELLDVMRRTMAGESVYPEGTPILEIGAARSAEFTQREVDVMEEIVLGHTYREIAENLHISENTLKSHVKSILSKTGYTNATQLAVDVVNKKFILPGF